uniref:Major facilitator superfamily (MFS) profile domain-containing protein n=1 Tax=Rhodococcus sp. NS1 TaxID=402236 RepID=A0A097SPY3_9NOCA|nr:hypothetical protein LRS1606.145 [Rhodococcus sp. NS1]
MAAYNTDVPRQEAIETTFSPPQRRVLLLCMFIALIDGFDILAIGYVLPAIASDWSVGPASLSIAVSAGLVGMIVSSILFGQLGDRWGRRSIILIATPVFTLATLMTALASSVEMLTVLRFVAGLGLGTIGPTVIALAAEYAPASKRAITVVLVGSSIAFGGFIAGVSIAWIIPAFGWRAVFLIGAVLPMIGLALTARYLPESVGFLATRAAKSGNDYEKRTSDTACHGTLEQVPPKDAMPDGVEQGGLAGLFSARFAIRTVLLWVVYFCGSLFAYFMFSWMPTILHSSGTSQGLAIYATSAMTLGTVVGGILLALIADRKRYGFRLLSLGFLAGGVATIALSVFIENLYLLLPLALLVGITAMGSQAASNAVASTLYPVAIRSTGLGWAYGVGRVGSVVSPLLGGLLLASSVEPSKVLMVAVVPAVVAAVAMAVIVARGVDNSAL